MSHRRSALSVAVLLAALAATVPASSGSAQSAALAPVRLAAPAQPSTKGAPRPERDAGTVLVKYRSGTSDTARRDSMARHGSQDGGAVGSTGYSLARIASGATPEQAVHEFRNDPDVVAAQLNYIRHADATPNDPGLSTGLQEYLKKIRLLAAWDQTKGSTAKLVAIVDTGIDTDHPDLVTRIHAGYNAIANNTNVVDDNGHGTFVAGVAAAITNNNRGVAGAAWLAGILPVKVLGSDGSGTDADIAEGIDWAADHGATVINLSLGGPGGSTILADAVNHALSKDAVVVAAAGNDFGPFASYPAAYPGVLAVSATDNSSTFAYFSNYGWWVDVSAPGTAITSTYAGPTELYATGAGTSFSAPLVAGVALLVRVKYPTYTQAQVWARIRNTARDYGPRGVDPFYGKGRLDAFAALGAAKLAAATQPAWDLQELNPTPDRARAIAGTSVSATISPEGDVDWYSKDMTTTGGSLTFTVNPPAYNPSVFRTREMDPVLEIYGPDLQPLGLEDSGFLGQSETLTVPVRTTGLYYAKVTNFGGSRTPANYTLTVATATTPPAVTFQPFTLTSVGNTAPESLAIADVTGDGRPDVVLANGTYSDPADDRHLLLFPQQANGALGSPTRLTTDAEYNDPVGLATGDVNGDELNDVVLATAHGIDAFYQSGGTLSAKTLIATSGALQVAMADLEGDGDQDLFVAGADGLWALRNEGGGSFTTVPVAPLPPLGFPDVRTADLNLDGLIDVVSFTTDGNGGSVQTFLQGPASTFTDGDTMPLSGGQIDGVAAGDVNGDGRADVVATVNGLSSSLAVFPTDATGHLTGPTSYASYQPQAVQIADLNRDGRGDVVVAHGDAGEIGVYVQNSGGTLNAEQLSSGRINTSFGPDGVAVGDIDGNGLPDVANVFFGGSAESGIVVHHQDGASFAGVPLWIRDITPADFSLNIGTLVSPKVEFTRDIDPASITSATVQFINANNGLALAAVRTYSAVTHTVTINPTPTLLKNTPYLVLISGVTDTNGKVFGGLFTFRFKTAV